MSAAGIRSTRVCPKSSVRVSVGPIPPSMRHRTPWMIVERSPPPEGRKARRLTAHAGDGRRTGPQPAASRPTIKPRQARLLVLPVDQTTSSQVTGTAEAAGRASASIAASARRWRSVIDPTVLVSDSGTADKYWRQRVRPQRRWLIKSSLTVIFSIGEGQRRITSAALTVPSAIWRLSSARARRTSLARCRARMHCGPPPTVVVAFITPLPLLAARPGQVGCRLLDISASTPGWERRSPGIPVSTPAPEPDACRARRRPSVALAAVTLRDCVGQINRRRDQRSLNASFLFCAARDRADRRAQGSSRSLHHGELSLKPPSR